MGYYYSFQRLSYVEINKFEINTFSLITQSLVILGEKNYSLVLDFPLNEQISKENVLQFAYGFYGTITVSIVVNYSLTDFGNIIMGQILPYHR
ncbi:Uncharacterized protein APZ42_028663 [Daphnia magna]|uniref:Uncharacterized protein n=1 Tax=Daphnia magna TaxID=35525 RepID=A0A164Q907_9CRUS|nr:Uncharacterized protein APZ42_028663 [Daphnia magna]